MAEHVQREVRGRSPGAYTPQIYDASLRWQYVVAILCYIATRVNIDIHGEIGSAVIFLNYYLSLAVTFACYFSQGAEGCASVSSTKTVIVFFFMCPFLLRVAEMFTHQWQI